MLLFSLLYSVFLFLGSLEAAQLAADDFYPYFITDFPHLCHRTINFSSYSKSLLAGHLLTVSLKKYPFF
jgi:hypothetical protein